MWADKEPYFYISLGVLFAVIWPILTGYIKKAFPPTAAIGIPPWLKKYLMLFAFCLVTGFIVLAIARSQGMEVKYWYQSFLLGFTWESVIEKIFVHAK